MLAAYTIEISSPELSDSGEDESEWLRTDERVLADLPAVMEIVAEKISEILPVGYSVEVIEANGE